jgi:hypothetical protein
MKFKAAAEATPVNALEHVLCHIKVASGSRRGSAGVVSDLRHGACEGADNLANDIVSTSLPQIPRKPNATGTALADTALAHKATMGAVRPIANIPHCGRAQRERNRVSRLMDRGDIKVMPELIKLIVAVFQKIPDVVLGFAQTTPSGAAAA